VLGLETGWGHEGESKKLVYRTVLSLIALFLNFWSGPGNVDQKVTF